MLRIDRSQREFQGLPQTLRQIEESQKLGVLAPEVDFSVPFNCARRLPVGDGCESQSVPVAVAARARRCEPVEHYWHASGPVGDAGGGKQTIGCAQVLSPVEEVGMRAEHVSSFRIALS